jgi:hypothetical protein
MLSAVAVHTKIMRVLALFGDVVIDRLPGAATLARLPRLRRPSFRVSIAWVSTVKGSGLTESEPQEPDAEDGS